jgi:hypothetical protein
MTQSIKGSRAGLFTVCQTIYTGVTDASGAPVLVTYGPPGAFQANNIVAVGMATRQPITRPTMAPTRSRDTHADIDIVISVFAPGDETQQQVACEAADDLVTLLETYFRTAPQETLSGACREAWVSNVDGPVPALAIDPESNAVTGRVATTTVTVTAAIRY